MFRAHQNWRTTVCPTTSAHNLRSKASATWTLSAYNGPIKCVRGCLSMHGCRQPSPFKLPSLASVDTYDAPPGTTIHWRINSARTSLPLPMKQRSSYVMRRSKGTSAACNMIGNTRSTFGQFYINYIELTILNILVMVKDMKGALMFRYIDERHGIITLWDHNVELNNINFSSWKRRPVLKTKFMNISNVFNSLL